MNAGPIIHPPLILMNAGPLEASDNYDIHSEGTQPAIRAVTDRLDLERIAVREALGFGAPHYPLKDHYTSDRWMYGDAHKKLVKSGDWREPVPLREHRYMTEDVVFGLAFLVSVARWAQRARAGRGRAAGDWPVRSSGKDLTQGERTLEALGLASLAREELFETAMKIACVGAGRMGRGIALAFALPGARSTLVDLKPRADFERLKAEAMQEMEASLAMLVELGAIPRVDLSGIRVVQAAKRCATPT